MSNIFEIDTAALIGSAAEKMKAAGVERPAYIDYAKSGPGKDRIPSGPDFWYIRCASVLRQVYVNGPVGLSKLRTRYGSKKGHVVHRHHHQRAGGSIIKDAFDTLEKLGYVKKTKSGRVITPAGKSFMDKIAGELAKKQGA